jgi:hypothetical protein
MEAERRDRELAFGAELNWNHYREVVDHETGKRYGEAPERENPDVYHRFFLKLEKH